MAKNTEEIDKDANVCFEKWFRKYVDDDIVVKDLVEKHGNSVSDDDYTFKKEALWDAFNEGAKFIIKNFNISEG